MTAATKERMTSFAGLVPSRGTFKIAANTLIRKGWLVGIDSAGRAVPGGLISAGCLAGMGKASSTVDNRTSSELGGAADAADVEVEYGVFGWASKTGGGDDIASDDRGKVCFVVDNQTVALSNGTDTRGIAGYVSEVDADGVVYVEMGPTIEGQIVIAAAEASELDIAQVTLAALNTSALTAHGVVDIPLTSFVDADGDPLAKWVDGSVDGFALVDSEAFCLRFNNGSTPPAMLTQVNLPPDLDDTADAQLEFLCSKTGATIGDATTITIAAQLLVDGDLHNGDTPVAIVTDAVVGNATARTTKRLTGTILASDIQANASAMTFSFKPTNSLLGTDDFLVHSVRLRYQKKLLAA